MLQHKKIEKIRQMNKNFIKDTWAILPCLIIFLVMFVGGAILFVIMLFMLPGILSAIGNMCLLMTIPLVLIVILAILAKKYFFKGGK